VVAVGPFILPLFLELGSILFFAAGFPTQRSTIAQPLQTIAQPLQRLVSPVVV